MNFGRNNMQYPIIYKQLKLLIKIWEKSKAEDKEVMIKMMKESMKEIENNLKYEE
jgi:hypothetical protein